MDVNVRDLDEIVRFGSSLKSFLSDYLTALNYVRNGANEDYTKARNALGTIRTYTESAERDLKSAERTLESTIDDANRNPDKDYSRQIEFRESQVEKAQMKYERNKQALEEAEGLIRRVKVNTDMVLEQITRSRNQINDIGHNALHSIQKSANSIARYKK